MNYKKIYNEIIEKSKLKGLNKRLLSYYTEFHHIVPKCLGGTNDKYNLVLLTGREHYLCHWLLWKMNKDNNSLFLAYHKMVYQKNKFQNRNFKLTSKQYGNLKITYSNMLSKRMKNVPKTEDWKNKHSLALRGHKTDDATKNKMRIAKSNKGTICRINDITFSCLRLARNYAKQNLNYSKTKFNENVEIIKNIQNSETHIPFNSKELFVDDIKFTSRSLAFKYVKDKYDIKSHHEMMKYVIENKFNMSTIEVPK